MSKTISLEAVVDRTRRAQVAQGKKEQAQAAVASEGSVQTPPAPAGCEPVKFYATAPPIEKPAPPREGLSPVFILAAFSAVLGGFYASRTILPTITRAPRVAQAPLAMKDAAAPAFSGDTLPPPMVLPPLVTQITTPAKPAYDRALRHKIGRFKRALLATKRQMRRLRHQVALERKNDQRLLDQARLAKKQELSTTFQPMVLAAAASAAVVPEQPVMPVSIRRMRPVPPGPEMSSLPTPQKNAANIFRAAQF